MFPRFMGDMSSIARAVTRLVTVPKIANLSYEKPGNVEKKRALEICYQSALENASFGFHRDK